MIRITGMNNEEDTELLMDMIKKAAEKVATIEEKKRRKKAKRKLDKERKMRLKKASEKCKRAIAASSMRREIERSVTGVLKRRGL